MINVRIDYCPKLPVNHDDVKDGNVQNFICNRRIVHATTASVVNNRYITMCTLNTQQEK